MGYRGRTETRVSDLERGVHNITVLTLLRLCHALQISISDFFAGCPQPEGGRSADPLITITCSELQTILARIMCSKTDRINRSGIAAKT